MRNSIFISCRHGFFTLREDRNLGERFCLKDLTNPSRRVRHFDLHTSATHKYLLHLQSDLRKLKRNNKVDRSFN